jgi:hypothetical protein
VIVPGNVAHEVQAGESDDAVLNAGIPCRLPASEIIRQFLNKWKYLSAFFSLANFLHPVLSVLHPSAIQRERSGTTVGTIFKLKNRGRAVLSENDQPSVIPIPANAMVTLVGGDIDEDAFVKIRYEGKVLMMLSEDLRSGGELWGRSA